MIRGVTKIFVCLLLTGAGLAADVFLEVDLDEPANESAVINGKVKTAGDQRVLELTNADPQGEETRVPVLRLTDFQIAKHPYALEGLVAVQALEKSAFLEMWSVFPDGSRYFTRTLSPSGPMGILKGTSDWRLFQLPFFKGDAQEDPSELLLNVVFRGKGTVALSQIKLVHYVPGRSATKAPGVWWSNQASGWIGGIGGCVLGLIGMLGALLRRKAARGWLRGLFIGLLVIGALCLAAGVLAVAQGQPFSVFYVLLLGGGLMVVISSSLLVMIRKMTRNEEFQRMRAMDA